MSSSDIKNMHSITIANLQQISKVYPKGIIALKEINLNIVEQEIIAIVGTNGSGKSTLLKIIAGSLKPEQGSINIFQLDAQKNAEQLKKLICYISQDRALDPEMTGMELLHYFSALYGLSGETAKQRINKLINTFELNPFISRRTHSYSGGQAQRLHIALGILHQPKLLLLDEPSSALDPNGKAFLWGFLKAYQQQGNTIILITHELKNIRKHCSRVLLLDKGKLIKNDTAVNIIQTHAKPVLHIKTTTILKKTESLRQLLQQTIPTIAIQVKDQSARLEINQSSELNKAKTLGLALKAFKEHQYSVIECRWEEPSLENAYFKLTGKTIVPPVTLNKNKNKNKNKKGQRKFR
ncbi:MAG: ABC transporter ATP-binding protein [Methylococcaceae bacterium]|nr:ABC transporter ATP-binding protein [Methylococcaceae bacterium]